MLQNRSNIIEMFNRPNGIWELLIAVILVCCTLAIGVSIALAFHGSKKQHIAKKEKKSVVETGTMTLFFVIFYFIIRLQIGVIVIASIPLKTGMIIVGLSIIIIGTYINVMGRMQLGKYWANQIKIYQDQKLMTSGVFKYVRHPLYASLIWIFFGASILFANVPALLSNLLIFIPFMYYRAKQEELLLRREFKEYNKYVNCTGMFFPKL